MRNAGMWLNFAPAMAAIIIIGMVALRAGLRLLRANSNATAFELRFWSGGALDELHATVAASPVHPMAAVFSAGMAEWRKSTGGAMADAPRRAERIATLAASREMMQLGQGGAAVATIASLAPLIGLAGAVWAALGVVSGADAGMAPAIAASMLSGLIVAIMAIIARDIIAGALTRFAARLDGFATEFAVILSRQHEER